MLYINIDTSDLEDLLDLGEVAKDEMEQAAANLTAATKAHIIEEAQHKLHTTRGKFIESLTHFQIEDGVWVVNLDASARWIDEGMDEHNMLDDLLKSKKAKRAKDGSTYLVVPFQLNKQKQELTPQQQRLLQTVKKELAKVGASPNGIENTSDGKPKLGLVRSMDITKAPVSTGANPIGRGTGHVAQGPTGIPLLKGVRIYQKEIKDKEGKSTTGRFVMTFRIASSKQKGGGSTSGDTEAWRKKQSGKDAKDRKSQGRWDHPGVPASNLMEEGEKWAMEQWESRIMPSLLAKIVMKLG